MDLDQAIRHRRAVRAYTDEGVDDDIVRRLVDAATQAPSALNEQPWGFVVIRDRAALDRLSTQAKQYQAQTGDANHGDTAQRLRTVLADPAFHIFYHAPALILICARDRRPWMGEECALAAQNLMLTAHALGLGSCWIGSARAYLATAVGRQLIDLPEHWIPIAPIVVGHPGATAAEVPRNAPEIRWLDPV